MSEVDFSDHFEAAVELIQDRAGVDREEMIDVIHDRSYEEVETEYATFRENLAKFELDLSGIDVATGWVRNELKLHDYLVANVVDRRFEDNFDPDRLLVVVKEASSPVRADIDSDE